MRIHYESQFDTTRRQAEQYVMDNAENKESDIRSLMNSIHQMQTPAPPPEAEATSSEALGVLPAIPDTWPPTSRATLETNGDPRETWVITFGRESDFRTGIAKRISVSN